MRNIDKFIVRAENTAIKQGVARSAFLLAEKAKWGQSLLDYGSGKLRNSEFLMTQGFDVTIVDTALQMSRLSDEQKHSYRGFYSYPWHPTEETFDGVLCAYVLNTIVCQQERQEVLQTIQNVLKPEGILVVEVRRAYGIKQNKTNMPYRDGFVVGKGTIRTFQKPFEKDELQHLLEDNGFDIEENIVRADSLIAIAKAKRRF